MLVKSVQIINNKKISFLQSEFLDCFYKYILECFARVYGCSVLIMKDTCQK